MRSLSVFLTLTGLIISLCAGSPKLGQQNERTIIGRRHAGPYVKKVYNFANSKRHLVPVQDENAAGGDLARDEKPVKEDDKSKNENINKRTRRPPRRPFPKTRQQREIEAAKQREIEAEKQREIEAGKQRGIKAGDTFTPDELLPITKKLIEKIEIPGEGRGIVSSAKNSEELADTLFEAFFSGPKRVVILKENDISGLDALQALALSGEEASNTGSYVTEPGDILPYRGQIVEVSQPKKSRYMLLTKPQIQKDALRTHKTKKKDTKYFKKNVLRKRVNLTRGLQKQRHLVLDPARKSNKINKTVTRRKKINNKPMSSKKGSVKSKHNQVKKRYHTKNPAKLSHRKITPASPRQNSIRTKSYPLKATCRWRYICSDPADLDTCRLQTQCSKNTLTSTKSDFIGPEAMDERSQDLRRFRKMLRITPVDEEVEKILEVRMLQLKPQLADDQDVARIETLSQYFNNILMAEMRETTTNRQRKFSVTEPGQNAEYNEDGDGVDDGSNKDDDKNTPKNEAEQPNGADGIVELEEDKQDRRSIGKPKVLGVSLGLKFK